MTCPQCHREAWRVQNPYFAIGLAADTHLIICGRCGLGAFRPTGPRPFL